MIIVIFSHLCAAVIRGGNAEIETQTSKGGVPVKAETFAERFFCFCNFTFVIDIVTALHLRKIKISCIFFLNNRKRRRAECFEKAHRTR